MGTETKVHHKEFQAYSLKPWYLQWQIIPFITVVYPYLGYVHMQHAEEEDQSVPQILLIVSIILHIVAHFGQHWSTKYRALVTLDKCAITSPNAYYIHITSSKPFAKSQLCPLIRKERGVLEINYCEKRMQYSAASGRFESPKFPTTAPLRTYLSGSSVGIKESEVEDKLFTFGRNSYDVKAPSFLDLFKQHATAPFFIFQLVCSAFWFLDDYWKTSLVSIFMLFFIEAQQVWQRLRDITSVHEMRPDDPILLWVLRDGEWKQVVSTELLPLELVAIARRADYHPITRNARLAQMESQVASLRAKGGSVPQFMLNGMQQMEKGEQSRVNKRMAAAGLGPDGDGVVLPCDMVLLSGSAVMNECSLTGESVPQRKEGLVSLFAAAGVSKCDSVGAQSLDMKGSHKSFVLYAGTKVVLHSAPGKDGEEGEEVVDKEKQHPLVREVMSIPPPPIEATICRVIRTGSHTTQGKIVRTILSSSERVSEGGMEPWLFLGGLCVMAFGAIWYVVKHTLEDEHRSRFKLFLSSCHILMAVVPPDFAVMLSCATTMSLLKLYQLRLFCTEPFRVPMAGKVIICAFDKTGTITSDNMESVGVFGLKGANAPTAELMAKVAGQSAANTGPGGIDDDTDEIERATKIAEAQFAKQQKKKQDETASNAKSASAHENAAKLAKLKNPEQRRALKRAKAEGAMASKQHLGFETRAVLSSCHSLVYVDNKLVGDGLELAGFHYGGGISVKDMSTFIAHPYDHANPIHNPKVLTTLDAIPVNNGPKDEFTIVRRFAFDSALRRMTNVVRHSGPAYNWTPGTASATTKSTLRPTGASIGMVLCKGAPSTIANLILASAAKNSSNSRPLAEVEAETKEFLSEASRLADKGYRVIALAHKYLTPATVSGANNNDTALHYAKNTASRDELESDLVFSGLLVLACPIKSGARASLSKLSASGHQLMMITGDAMLTACRVAVDVSLANPDKPWLELVPLSIVSSSSSSVVSSTADVLPGHILPSAGEEVESAVKSLLNSQQQNETANAGSRASNSLANVESLFGWRRATDGKVFPLQLYSKRSSDANSQAKLETVFDQLTSLWSDHNICVSGAVLGLVLTLSERALSTSTATGNGGKPLTDVELAASSPISLLLPFVSVFARTSPQQKELILRACQQALGISTLMCGDGTNDVGALKVADVGVSVMNQPIENMVPMAVKNKIATQMKQLQQKEQLGVYRMTPISAAELRAQKAADIKAQWDLQMAEMQAEMSGGELIKLGDASIASPFTYHGQSIKSVNHLIRTGRAVQAAMVQLYMVTALSSLVCAISMSVLRLDGLKTGDTQATLESLILMTLMMSVSRAPPAVDLPDSPARPPLSIFEPSMLISLFLQGLIHSVCLLGGWWLAKTKREQDLLAQGLDFDPDIDGDFKPNDVNTAVFLLRNAVQASCFLANYEGAPFLESLKENKSIFYGAAIACASLLAIATDFMPEITSLFECTSLAGTGLQEALLALLIADMSFSILVGYYCREWRKNRANKKAIQEGGQSGSALILAVRKAIGYHGAAVDANKKQKQE